jgi:protein involved in plasmid replication-relaxation
MVNVRLSERDVRVVSKCALSKWLTTGQLARLYFPKVTPDAVRKSLRRLVEAGYLVVHREHQMAEALHGLGPKGKAHLEAKGVAAEVTRKPPRQIEHMLGINDVRVAVEVRPAQVAYFFASWELPGLGWVHPVIPDAVMGLRLPERRTFLVEYDRGTETLPTFVGKLRGYEGGLSGIPFRALLLMTDTDSRLETLARHVRKEGFLRRILGCVRTDLSTEGIDAPLFLDLRRIHPDKCTLRESAE